jgi:type IV pilus assembly protein PilB
MPAKPLGAYLLEAGTVSKQQLDAALAQTRGSGELLGETIVRLGFASSGAIAAALAHQAGIPHLDLSQHTPNRELAALIPEAFARKHTLVAIAQEAFALTVAMADISDVTVIDELQRNTKRFIKVAWANENAIQKHIDLTYGSQGPRRAAPTEDVQQAEVRADEAAATVSVDTPVTRLVEDLFQRGSKDGATDIHINPDEKIVRIRYRLDGILYPGPTIPKELHASIITRIKILGGLNISESRLPQDGRILYLDGPYRLDLRVSTFPTLHGENVVIRILDKSRTFGLENLGFPPDGLQIFKRLIARPHGLVLVTGPTGSGKTTTLYSALSAINSVDVNIITLEDPVEYELPLIRQCQINARAGLTFVTGLRAILRHDPDIILVGEMRDAETVETTVRAALTGHMVFSTFHTNDALGTLPRLLNMGVEPFLVASSLLGVIAQRLVRVICEHCKQEVTPDDEVLARVGSKTHKVSTFYKGKGCGACKQTGYRGRQGIFEILPITPRFADLINDKAAPGAFAKAARDEGMATMFEDGLRKVSSGVTTLEELIRVTQALD